MIKCQSFTWGKCTECNAIIKVQPNQDMCNLQCKCVEKPEVKPVKRRTVRKKEDECLPTNK